MSLRSGAGIDGLQNAASTLVFGELDWSPGVHRQAIGRLGRPGQTRPVLAYFCTTDDGADPVMLDTLNIKSMEVDRLIEPEHPKLQVVSEEGVRPDRIKLLAESVLERADSLPQRRTA
jgi:SNF2 family DNA or RNA helicase